MFHQRKIHSIILVAIFSLFYCSFASATNQLFSNKEICMAALTTLNMWSKKPTGGESKMGKFIKAEGNKYIFKSSTSQWKCTLTGDKVMWGMKDGRWRNDPKDEVVKYSVSGEQLTISQIYGAGAGDTVMKTFSKKQVKELF